MVHNSKFGKGRYDQNNYQKSVFYTGWIGWTGCQLVESVAKNFENLIECSWKSEESMKKNGTQFRVRKREIWSKQARVLRTSTCPYKLQLS